MKLKTMVLLPLSLLFFANEAASQTAENEKWQIEYSDKGINKIVCLDDQYKANFLNGNLGELNFAYKIKNGYWATIQDNKRTMSVSENGNVITYKDKTLGDALDVTQIFTLKEDKIEWRIDIVNNSKYPIQIGDLGIKIPWRSGGDTQKYIFEQTFTKHAYISGYNSFLYFTRFSGVAPYILICVDPDTKLEYFATGKTRQNKEGYFAYVLSGKTGGRETNGTWRQEHTSVTLNPKGEKGSEFSCGFTINAADSYQDLRDKIFANKGIDTRVVPGMTIANTQKAKFALRTECKIDSITAEFPKNTVIENLGKKGDSYIYQVSFKKLGENMLTVYFDGNRKTYLEFFCSESPEVLMKKRASFLVNHQQFRDSSKWYNGMYGEFDMMHGELRGPDNPDIYDEVLTYFLCSDDPILGKAPYLASKNVVFPDDKEIESLEYHIENFVWGKLQRTDKETPYQYGVYGTPDWNLNRDTALRRLHTEYRLDRTRVWRTYDYPHVMMLYFHMYQIAKLYPEKSKYLDAAGYLERAYQTAMAYFYYPMELLGDYYETFKWGCYNELLICDLIDILEKEGRKDASQKLRAEWEKKAKYFIYDDPYPYRSEYIADRTAFESTYALAKYAIMNPMKADKNLWFDKNTEKWYSHPDVTVEAARDFMERQHYAGLSCRGWLETQWFLLGSDFFGGSDWSTHSYMARMGGWSVLDYGLRYADKPYDWLQLGYASYLDPFGLINAGTEKSNYGYWYPGKEKDGAMGQAFTPTKVGRAWIQTEENRRPWRYCGEGDIGMCAITRMGSTILACDPVFGWTAYGGNLEENDKEFKVISDDGVRNKFWLVDDNARIGMFLDRDNWSTEKAISVSKKLDKVILPVKNLIGDSHSTTLTVEVIGKAVPEVLMDGKKITHKKDKYGNFIFRFPVAKENHNIEVRIKR